MSDLLPLSVPLAIASLAVLVLLMDVRRPPTATPPPSPPLRRGLGGLVAAGLGAILLATFFVDARGSAVHGAYEGGLWTTAVHRLILAAGVLAALGGIDDVARRTPGRVGEYWLLLLFSLVGMGLLAGARDLVLFVVAFELMGIPLYVLAAYAKTDATTVAGGAAAAKGPAAEAAFKLYVVGATSSAVTLFGLALLTGLQGTTRIDALGASPLSPLASVGLVFVLGGLGYKVGIVPFHMWVPDTYQGASAPFVAFLSVAPKAATLSALTTLFAGGLGSEGGTWVPAVALLSFLSMAIGNLLALVQTDLRRLLGYSGIAQMGYVLASLAAKDAFGAGMTLFFLTAYLFTNMGMFLLVHALSGGGEDYSFASLSGLWKRSPPLAAALLAFLLSLAGIPFVVGFWAKLYVFIAAWRAGLAPLVVAAIVLAVVGLFYYLRVLRMAYMTEPVVIGAPRTPAGLGGAIAICAIAVVALGLWPAPLVDGSLKAAEALLKGQSAVVGAALQRP